MRCCWTWSHPGCPTLGKLTNPSLLPISCKLASSSLRPWWGKCMCRWTLKQNPFPTTIQGEETRERVARMEEALAHLLGQKFDQPGHLDHLDHPGHLDHLDHLDHPGHLDHLPAAEQAGSQYQSAEQLIDNDRHKSISRQISAIMEQQRSHLEEEDEEVTQGEDPFNIPDEEEFFIARQTLRTTTNQS